MNLFEYSGGIRKTVADKKEAEQQIKGTPVNTQTLQTPLNYPWKISGDYIDTVAQPNYAPDITTKPKSVFSMTPSQLKTWRAKNIEPINKNEYKQGDHEIVDKGTNIKGTEEYKIDLNKINGTGIWGDMKGLLFGKYDDFGNKGMGLVDAAPLAQTGFNIWSGIKGYDLQKDALEYQQEMDKLNLNNQVALTNMNLVRDENYRRAMAGQQKFTDEDMQKYLNVNGMKGLA